MSGCDKVGQVHGESARNRWHAIVCTHVQCVGKLLTDLKVWLVSLLFVISPAMFLLTHWRVKSYVHSKYMCSISALEEATVKNIPLCKGYFSGWWPVLSYRWLIDPKSMRTFFCNFNGKANFMRKISSQRKLLTGNWRIIFVHIMHNKTKRNIYLLPHPSNNNVCAVRAWLNILVK